MKIEHIAMYVNELESARDFFVKYFDGISNAPVQRCIILSQVHSIIRKRKIQDRREKRGKRAGGDMHACA